MWFYSIAAFILYAKLSFSIVEDYVGLCFVIFMSILVSKYFETVMLIKSASQSYLQIFKMILECNKLKVLDTFLPVGEVNLSK